MSRAARADEGVPGSLLETPWSPRKQDRVGFFGCSAAGGRIVRIGLLGKPRGKPPKSVKVQCPACGQEHRVTPSWRRPADLDEGREPEILIDAADFAREPDDEGVDEPDDGA